MEFTKLRNPNEISGYYIRVVNPLQVLLLKYNEVDSVTQDFLWKKKKIPKVINGTTIEDWYIYSFKNFYGYLLVVHIVHTEL